MSMLTAQVDELREKAKLLRTHADGLNAPYVVPSTKELMALTMLDSASRMEQAAYTIESLRDRLQAVTLGTEINGETSDGYHTFNELYHHRAVLFSVIVRDHRELAWKARKHHDGTMYDGMFIVGIETPKGQATYHYDLDPYWEMFDCEERDFAPKWDGHTPDDAIARIAELGSEPPYDELIRYLENDWNISASWDGLRKFWCIELTEEGVRMRDAELGNGTCEVIGSYYYDDYDQYEFEFSCGHSVNMYDKEPPNYCPNCGAKIIQGVDNAD